MPTHNFTYNWSRNGESISNVVSVTTDGEYNFDVSLTSEQADKQVLIVLDQSALASICISTTVDVTIETNNSATPDDTLGVNAGEPLIWTNVSGLTCPITQDVTTVYVTNEEATAGTVKFRFLQDATP